MITLALPEPSLARHLARTIDGRSLTGVPGEWSTLIKRKPFRKTRAKKPAPRWEIRVYHPTSPNMRLWAMVSLFKGNVTAQTVVLACSKKEATKKHLDALWRERPYLKSKLIHTSGYEPGRRL
jgi:hypothetical protein